MYMYIYFFFLLSDAVIQWSASHQYIRTEGPIWMCNRTYLFPYSLVCIELHITENSE